MRCTARDARIGREVAIKILPAEAVGSADRLRRFEQEARAAGSLNHPNLVTIYDVGADHGSPYYVNAPFDTGNQPTIGLQQVTRASHATAQTAQEAAIARHEQDASASPARLGERSSGGTLEVK